MDDMNRRKMILTSQDVRTVNIIVGLLLSILVCLNGIRCMLGITESSMIFNLLYLHFNLWTNSWVTLALSDTVPFMLSGIPTTMVSTSYVYNHDYLYKNKPVQNISHSLRKMNQYHCEHYIYISPTDSYKQKQLLHDLSVYNGLPILNYRFHTNN